MRLSLNGKLHPSIKKFWTDQGYELFYYSDSRYVYAHKFDGDGQITNSYTIAYIWDMHKIICYYFDYKNNQREYKEEEALRIIKLIAFL